MATGGLLSMRLGQIRRRLRLQAAIEGGVAGAALAALGLAVGVAIARGRGGAPAARDLAALMVLGTAAGAAARGARRIALTRCARIADAALDNQDRVLSALCLDATAPSPFARALVADAVRRAEVLVPSAAVPARRPAGLSALGLAGLALAAAALVPGASHAARVAPSPVASEPRRPLPGGALDSEREATRDAMAEAARLGDERLAKLAAELDRALGRLTDGELNDGAALDLLRAFGARAAEAAGEARREGLAAEAVSRALEVNTETRAAGSALAKTVTGAGDDEQARQALGASAAAHPKETARALTAAAQNMAGAAGNGSDAAGPESKDGPRRLERDAPNERATSEAGTPRADDPEARHLEQLRRDLDDAAAACRDGDASCRSRAEDRARDLARLGRQGAARDSLQRLQRTAEQLRARIGRGELRSGDSQAMRSFGRAARGDEAPSDTGHDGDGKKTGGDDPAGAGDAQGQEGQASEGGAGTRATKPEGDDGQAHANGAEAATASAAFGAEGGEAPGHEEAGTGNGIGHQPGGAPLGARAAPGGSVSGSEADVPVADGAGPGRAEVIGTAAGHGFASRGYARMFGDYAAAVEDALGATAVPEGKRYLVRRYFDLIRPRPPGRASRSRP